MNFTTLKSLLFSQSFFTDALRFIFVGGLNTSVTLLLYQLFLFILSPPIAYALSWTAGFFLAILFYPTLIFLRAHSSNTARLSFALTYFLVFSSGLGLLSLFDTTGLSSRISIIFVLVLTSSLSFLAGRCIFRRPRLTD